MSGEPVRGLLPEKKQQQKHVQRPSSSLPRGPQCPAHRGEERAASSLCSSRPSSSNDRTSSGTSHATRVRSSTLRSHNAARLCSTARPRGGPYAYAHAPPTWWLLSSPWSLSSPHARTVWTRAQSLWASSGSHGDSDCPSGGCHHSDGAAGRDVPVGAGADGVSTLPAGHHHPHQSRRGANEHALLPLLLLCWL